VAITPCTGTGGQRGRIEASRPHTTSRYLELNSGVHVVIVR
jgi:hypothetical protein